MITDFKFQIPTVFTIPFFLLAETFKVKLQIKKVEFQPWWISVLIFASISWTWAQSYFFEMSLESTFMAFSLSLVSHECPLWWLNLFSLLLALSNPVKCCLNHHFHCLTHLGNFLEKNLDHHHHLLRQSLWHLSSLEVLREVLLSMSDQLKQLWTKSRREETAVMKLENYKYFYFIRRDIFCSISSGLKMVKRRWHLKIPVSECSESRLF